MFFGLLQNPLLILPIIVAILIALTVHEFAHALVADKMGDSTAKSLGRLTLNPLAHLDPIGFLMLLFVGFGWAKPVPINTHNLKNPKMGDILISVAGPISNLLMAALSIGVVYILVFMSLLPVDSLLSTFLVYLILFNVILAVFNLIPIPPLDGSHILFTLIPERFVEFRQKFKMYGPMVFLAIVFIDLATPLEIFAPLFSFFVEGVFSLLP